MILQLITLDQYLKQDFEPASVVSVYSRWWMSLGFAIVEAVILACYSLPYSIYVASHR